MFGRKKQERNPSAVAAEARARDYMAPHIERANRERDEREAALKSRGRKR